MSARTYRPGSLPRFALAAVIALGFAATLLVFYPGVMTYDAVYVHLAAMNGHHGDWQSPLMSALWGAIDPVAPGAASMFILIATLYWAGFAILAVTLARTRPWAALIVPLLALSPPAFILVGVIWRDVLFASLWLVAAALAFAVADRRATIRLPVLAVALVLFACGVLIRPNALPAAPILGVYLLWPRAYSFKRLVVAAVPMALVLFALVQIVYYGALGAERQHPLHSLLVYDLAGISHFSGVNAFPVTWTAAQDRLLTTTCYDPGLWDVYWNREPCRFVMDRIEKQEHLFGTPALPRAWLAAIQTAPLAYLAHRTAVFGQFLFGDNLVGWFFDVAAPGQILRADDRVFMAMMAVHDALKATPLFRMAVWLFGSLVIATLAWRRRTTPAGAFALATSASGAAFLASYWAVGVAADYRYGYWTVLASLAGAAALAIRQWPIAATGNADAGSGAGTSVN